MFSPKNTKLIDTVSTTNKDGSITTVMTYQYTVTNTIFPQTVILEAQATIDNTNVLIQTAQPYTPQSEISLQTNPAPEDAQQNG